MAKVNYEKKLQQAIESKPAFELIAIFKASVRTKFNTEYEQKNNEKLQKKMRDRIVYLGYGNAIAGL